MTASIEGFLDVAGPAAIVIKDELAPVEGLDSPFFPPTFAAGDSFEGGYNIDGDGARSVCLVDSVGSQANRIEPMFRTAPYSTLVPQIDIRAGEHTVSIFEAGHRAGDAIVRCSALQEEVEAAFRALLRGNAAPLAKLAPTSLVFGVWDSRGTQAKAPRVFSSTIRAYDVQLLRRSAQYNPAIDYVANGLLDEAQEAGQKKAYGERGFNYVPATGTHGGIIARGGIRRDATLSLAALSLIRGTDAAETKKVQEYILGLALVALTANASGYLRQGCNLVMNAEKGDPRRAEEVYRNGERKKFVLSHQEAIALASRAAAAFGVGESRIVEFDKERAKRDLAGDERKGTKAKKGKS